jgi:SAM-dependent methyltransferase
MPRESGLQGLQWVCPIHSIELRRSAQGDAFVCAQGCHFRIEGGIPRFVERKNYASGFGLQWNAFRKTQLDSYTGTTISADRLRRIAGGDLGIFEGKRVLEAGCGAGRFTEVMLAHGARVFAADLSTAVEANYANFSHATGYFVCQADITKLPVAPGQFDIVVCIGVIQHTPDPEATIAALCRYLRPGGLLLIDHYSHGYETLVRRVLRKLVLRLPASLGSRVTLGLARVLVPVHQLTWHPGGLAARVRARLACWSPLVDYYDAYPALPRSILAEWAVLDTHDTLTDVYKHLRSVEQIRATLEAAGLCVLAASPGGNGVEARAIRPVEQRCAA